MNELLRAGLLVGTLASPPELHMPAQAVPVQQEDAWLGNDKFRHFWVSFAATSYAFGAMTAAGQDTDTALALSIPVAAVLGLGKEVHDRRTGRIFSRRDLVADALGIAAAFFLLREVR